MMVSQIIEFSREVNVSDLLSYLSVDFNDEIRRAYPDMSNFVIRQMNQSSVYTSGNSVMITTRLLIDA